MYVYVCINKTLGGARRGGVVWVLLPLTERHHQLQQQAHHHCCNLKIHSCRVTSERRQPSRGSRTKRIALRTKYCECTQNGAALLVSLLRFVFVVFIYLLVFIVAATSAGCVCLRAFKHAAAAAVTVVADAIAHWRKCQQNAVIVNKA